MAGLAALQSAFMAQLLDENAPPADGLGARQAAGMHIYRNNYRTALVEALEHTYAKTERWVGRGPFRRAATHHLVRNPPCSWTLDDAGAHFDHTCSELFRNNPEVSELAWLEWHLQAAFTARDAAPLDAPGFSSATAGYDAAAWHDLRLDFVPGVYARTVKHDLPAIWRATERDGHPRPPVDLPTAQALVVWREGERSTFVTAPAEEAQAIAALKAGATYGEMCLLLAGDRPSEEDARAAAQRAGTLLGKWLQAGLIAAPAR